VLVIVHSGQTGVERGAHRASLAAGLAIAGFMPLDKRDELGPVPDDVAKHLTPCFERGPRAAVRANVALASGVLVVVPDRRHVDKFTAMRAIMTAVRSARTQSYICDPSSDTDEVVAWARHLPETSGSVRILVTGPRGTRWIEGEGVARRLVTAIAIT
jgi:Circularly permutated YpsA SLOG family